MRTIINKLSLVLFALLLFTACDNDEYGIEKNLDSDNEKIQFDIVVGSDAATSFDMKTRASTSTDGTYTTTWSNGDEIGIYIVKGDGGLQSSGNWVDNMKMTYNNGNWTYSFPSGTGYYPADGDKLNFYAYYPYQGMYNDALSLRMLTFNNQDDSESFQRSDVLTATTLDIGKRSTPVPLTFSHLLAMVEVSVFDGGSGAQMTSETEVTFEKSDLGFIYNLSTQEKETFDVVNPTTMYRVEQSGDADYQTKYTYRAIVPIQTIPAGTELFRFSQTQGSIIRTLSYKLSEELTLSPGEVKPYNITLQNNPSEDHVYAVGDYYPYKGLPILGIVFEVSNGGRNGKMISIKEIRDVPWGDPTVNELRDGVDGIRDKDDGEEGTRNLIIKRKDQTNFSSTYSGFNWIYQTMNNGDINGRWYMPALNEMESFWNVWVIDKEGFNSKLSKVGGNTLWDQSWYWTSSEYQFSNGKFAHFIELLHFWDFYYGESKSFHHNQIAIRPISKF